MPSAIGSICFEQWCVLYGTTIHSPVHLCTIQVLDDGSMFGDGHANPRVNKIVECMNA
jgi:hypothetical protein